VVFHNTSKPTQDNITEQSTAAFFYKLANQVLTIIQSLYTTQPVLLSQSLYYVKSNELDNERRTN
jgi:hypothetical protein